MKKKKKMKCKVDEVDKFVDEEVVKKEKKCCKCECRLVKEFVV